MILGIITLVLLAIFLFFYLRDPRSLIIGFLFNLFFFSSLILIVYVGITSEHIIWRIIALIPIVIIMLMSIFGAFVLMVLLFLNARVLMKKEGRRFSNSLTLILGICILLFLLFSTINPERFVFPNFGPIFSGFSLVIVYFFIHVLTFLTAYFLYQFNKPKYNQDFIIVLGSGLINDKVPPLLASRINKAIDFYWKQTAVASSPTIIFSGGQGPNENLPEAEAMQKYAVEKGVPIEDTIQENRSVNTYQNMLFSKQIMDSLKSKYNCIFTTNNFHLFRAGLYAKQAGLNSQGIGSKTAFFYWPNAMIREYIAIIVMSRKRHMKVVGIILGFSILLTISSFIIDYYL
ncbi:YdcF family protein [Bacillus cereus group sp. Bc222]|uniref:YdcF family protein n=1 Tax=Bacillus cereus group sp. Bc222 TaxID=3018111 RepID=UPI0022E05458|nr:YdcF family protein [Bacillus cereus group sp. Bc222]MDA2241170.1 YdcF family protein [Bacillus cereus group sp. Bc222]